MRCRFKDAQCTNKCRFRSQCVPEQNAVDPEKKTVVVYTVNVDATGKPITTSKEVKLKV